MQHCILATLALVLNLLLCSSQRWCHRDWPAKGRWKEDPPYWEPDGCPNMPFGQVETAKCMQGRTLYVIGNSVARQAAFGMVEMLGGSSVKRENQRDMCPKHETFWGDSCHQEYASVKIRYLFLQFMDGFNYTTRNGFPYFRRNQTDTNTTTAAATYGRVPAALTPDFYAPGSMWADDNCIHQLTRTCFAAFFNESKKDDVLLFTLGMSYGFWPDERKNINNKERIDVRAWLTASAVNFKAHLAATFKGQVFRVTLAQLHKQRNMAHMTPMMALVNVHVWQLWQPGNEEMPWYTIDQWSINENKDHLYDDHVHFNGKLTHAMLHQVLNELCPNGGIPGSIVAWPNHNLAGHVVINSANASESYYILGEQQDRGAFGYLSPLPDSRGVPFYLQGAPRVELTSAQILAISVAHNALPDVEEGMLIKGMADRSVYLVKNGTLCQFTSGDAFLSKGYSFENVVIVPNYVIEMAAKGEKLT